MQTIVQRAHVYPGNSVAFTNPVTAGNTIVVGATAGGSGGVPFSAVPTDNQGNIYDEVVNDYTLLASGHTVAAIWVAKNVAAGSTTITIQNLADVGFTAYEISNVDPVNPVADSAVNKAPGTDPMEVTLDLTRDGGIYAFWGDETINLHNGWTGVTQQGFDGGHYDSDAADTAVAAGSHTIGLDLASTGTSTSLVMAVALHEPEPPSAPNAWIGL